MAKLSPFDFLNAINFSKEDLIGEDKEVEKAYPPFMVNRGLSYFNDTVLIANEMNINYHISSRMQFEFLKGIIRKRKRFSKWFKPDKMGADLQLVKDHYGYSDQKALDVIELLTEADLDEIRKLRDRGGIR